MRRAAGGDIGGAGPHWLGIAGFDDTDLAVLVEACSKPGRIGGRHMLYDQHRRAIVGQGPQQAEQGLDAARGRTDRDDLVGRSRSG